MPGPQPHNRVWNGEGRKMADGEGRFGIEDLLAAGGGVDILRLDAATAELGQTRERHRRAQVAVLLGSRCLSDDEHPGLWIAFEQLGLLRGLGYRLENLPDDFAAFRSRLGAANLVREDGCSLSYIDYALEFAQLPATRRGAVEARWRTAEEDRRYLPGRTDCGRFSLPVVEFGDVAIAFLSDIHGSVPRHWELALAFWLASDFRADRVALIDTPDPSRHGHEG